MASIIHFDVQMNTRENMEMNKCFPVRDFPKNTRVFLFARNNDNNNHCHFDSCLVIRMLDYAKVLTGILLDWGFLLENGESVVKRSRERQRKNSTMGGNHEESESERKCGNERNTHVNLVHLGRDLKFICTRKYNYMNYANTNIDHK